MVGTIADVTPQQEQTDLLQSSERQLRDAQRLAKVGNWRALPKEGLENGPENAPIFMVSCRQIMRIPLMYGARDS